MDDKINTFIFGKPLSEISPVLQNMHESVSLIDLAEKIRAHTSSNSETQAAEKSQKSETPK